MTVLSATELDHCREVALEKGGLFEFTSRFLPASRFEEYLALYATVILVRTIPASAVDDSVKWTQLKWWMEELAADSIKQSRHPVLKALVTSGANRKFVDGKLQRLVTDALMCIDIVPDSNENGLFERLSLTGTSAIELELELDGVVTTTQDLKSLGAATGLYDVLYGLSIGESTSFQQIPMNHLAKHNLGATELQEEKNRAALVSIVEDLAETALQWFAEGAMDLDQREGQHLQLTLAMQRRRLSAVSKNAASFLQNSNRYGPSDAWFAWRFLRALN